MQVPPTLDTHVSLSPAAASMARTKALDMNSYGGNIDISDVWEAFYWCNALGCTFEELRAAVKARGTSAAAVRAYFHR